MLSSEVEPFCALMPSAHGGLCQRLSSPGEPAVHGSWISIITGQQLFTVLGLFKERIPEVKDSVLESMLSEVK